MITYFLHFILCILLYIILVSKLYKYIFLGRKGIGKQEINKKNKYEINIHKHITNNKKNILINICD